MSLEEKLKEVKTPQELMEFMNENIKYGWIGKDNNIRISSIEDFRTQYRMASMEEILENGIGICFEQVELERKFFNDKNIKTKTYSIYTSHMAHAFLYYKIDDILYYKFEHSSLKCRGIFEYKSENELLKAEIISFAQRHKIKNIKKLKLIEYDYITENMDMNQILEKFKGKENMLFEILGDHFDSEELLKEE